MTLVAARPALLAVEQLSFHYTRRPAPGSRPILDDITLDIPSGSLIALLGPNGSGKTTLLKLLMGMLTPSAGCVRLEGKPLASIGRRERARRLAYVPQETSPAFEYTVLEIVLMGRYPHLGTFALERADDLAVAEQALHATGTHHLAERSFATLSGGERQRVVIAAALAQSPELLLLDEPTASLDIGAELEIAKLLMRLNAERGLTIVLSTHDLNFTGRVCRHTALLSAGHLRASGLTADVLTPSQIRSLYGVDADVQRHEPDGCLTVTPRGLAE
jgi:iron complex transport system ATP-binding protein